MNLIELKRLVDGALDEGAPKETPVCLWNGEDEEVQELCTPGVLAAGPYRFDPSPKMGGNAIAKHGTYFLLTGTTQDVPEHARQTNS